MVYWFSCNTINYIAIYIESRFRMKTLVITILYLSISALTGSDNDPADPPYKE